MIAGFTRRLQWVRAARCNDVATGETQHGKMDPFPSAAARPVLGRWKANAIRFTPATSLRGQSRARTVETPEVQVKRPCDPRDESASGTIFTARAKNDFTRPEGARSGSSSGPRLLAGRQADRASGPPYAGKITMRAKLGVVSAERLHSPSPRPATNSSLHLRERRHRPSTAAQGQVVRAVGARQEL